MKKAKIDPFEEFLKEREAYLADLLKRRADRIKDLKRPPKVQQRQMDMALGQLIEIQHTRNMLKTMNE